MTETRNRLYLPRDSNAYRFACLVWDGLPYHVACIRLNVSADAAFEWRRDLRLQAQEATGKPMDEITYYYAVRLLLNDGEL